MKKIYVKLASIVLIFVMCLTSLVGCGLVTTDNERDMNQVVATVQIEAGAPVDNVYKKDMIMAYMNYGYMYEQYYGYSRQDTFEFIIDSLVNNRVLVQNAIKDYQVKNNNTSWDIVEYLSEESKIEAEYSAKKAMSDLLESYKTQPDAEVQDTAWQTVRTTPANAANKEEELTLEQKKNYVVVNDDVATFNKVIELLRVNELLGKDYKSGDITTTEYYKQTLESYQESELIESYENSKRAEIRAKYDFEALKKAYNEKYDEQNSLTDTELAEKFSSASASDPVLVGANGGYGYVYNLLIGADSVLSAEVSAIKTDLNNKNITKEDYAKERAKILKATIVTDQRSTWITSGYDFDGAFFTGDYTFAKNENNRLSFKGVVSQIKEATEDQAALYKVNSLTEYHLGEYDPNDELNFVNMMERYLYGSVQAKVADSNPSVYAKLQAPALAEEDEYANKINELLFAFSTDSGSLNTYKGYLIKPVPEGSDSEEYMQEFADAARELINMKGSSYIMVATDYGYHIMFYSEILSKTDYNFDSLEKYLDDLYGAKAWATEYANMLSNWDNFEDTDNYMYLLANSLFSTEVDNAISAYQRDTLNTYRFSENGGVEIFEDRYADLLA